MAPPRATSILRPSFDEERRLWREGFRLIAGVDEVGRGPLAGPVMAAAVVLPLWLSEASWLLELRDSKSLSAAQREALYPLILGEAVAVGLGSVSPQNIDEMGIAAAVRHAMTQAIAGLWPRPDFVLTDAVSLPGVGLPQKGIIKGDCLSLSIAAASIIAKVARDRFMVQMDRLYPGYGMARHKGYATPEHLAALQMLGACPLHRRCFAPVAEIVRLRQARETTP